MNMGLKEKIKDFNLRDNEGIDKDDNNGKISEAFKPIAETILSGHFKVTKNNSDSYVTVHPTCVEMYYHEKVKIRLRTILYIIETVMMGKTRRIYFRSEFFIIMYPV